MKRSAILLALCVSLAGCGGGGMSSLAGGAVAPLPPLKTPTPAPIIVTPSPTPTATPVPATPSPSPSPTPAALSVSSSTLNVGYIYPASAGTTASEYGYAGSFSETDTCAGIATISQSGATFTASQIVPTSPASGGLVSTSCTLTIHDAFGQTASVQVNSYFLEIIGE